MATDKKCRFCGGSGHGALLCYSRPKNRALPAQTMKRIGKYGQKWLRVRKEWFDNHPAASYVCYYCQDNLTLKETTLDHYHSRSRRPDLRFELSNLVPCCYRCNAEKGSRSGDEMVK